MDAWAGVRPSRFYAGMRWPLAEPEGIESVHGSAPDSAALTPDQGGAATTRQMAAANLAAYRNR